MTTVGDLVQNVRREVFGMQRPEYNELTNTLTAVDTTITVVNDTGAIQPGSLIAIDDELVYTWSLSGQAAVVRRAMLGTTAAVHTAGALVEVNPMFPDVVIRDMLRVELQSWGPKVGSIDTVALSAISGARDVDLAGIPTDFYEVLEVLRSPRADATTWIPVGWRVERNMDLLDYPSGTALFLDTEGEKAIDLRVTYIAPFNVTAFDNGVDLDDVGMATSQQDIAVLGAIWRLVLGREIKRNFIEAQGDPRSAQEVPPGAVANSARLMKAMRDERLREEIMRIRALYPFRRR